MFGLGGKLALVTGSSTGIGFALADALAAAGARVILNARNCERLEKAASLLRAKGHEIDALPFDVTDPGEVTRAIDRIESEIGSLDILVNNAGMQYRSPLEQFPDEAWQALMRLNLDSVFYISKAAARYMIERRSGRIINICSVQSEVARATIAPYTASKGAVKMLTKGMAVDWGKYGINVNGIGPGYFKTELTEPLVRDEKFSAWVASRTPNGRWGEVAELGGAVVFLASEASSFVNGHILYVDGGLTASL